MLWFDNEITNILTVSSHAGREKETAAKEATKEAARPRACRAFNATDVDSMDISRGGAERTMSAGSVANGATCGRIAEPHGIGRRRKGKEKASTTWNRKRVAAVAVQASTFSKKWKAQSSSP